MKIISSKKSSDVNIVTRVLDTINFRYTGFVFKDGVISKSRRDLGV